MEPGRVVITCEEIDPDFKNSFVRKNYTGREGHLIYKKHFNIIPHKQHDRFVIKDTI